MSNNQNPNRYTAMDIYNRKYWNNQNSGSGRVSKSYFVALRDRVVTELETIGYCELLDYFIEGSIDSIDYVTYAVFADIVREYTNGDSADVFKNPNDAKYVPYIPMSYKWGVIERNPLFYQMDMQGIIKILHEARNFGRNVHRKACLENMMRSAEPQKDQKELLQRAEKAERELQRMKDNEGQRTREAQAEADSIKRNAQTEADEIVASAKKASVERADELVSEYIADSQKQYKKELEDDMSRLSEEFLSKTKRADDYHEEMNNSTNAFQRDWVRTMDNALEQLNTVKADFYKHLHDWQSSLYKNQTEPLAERFVELYRIINVDKLLREEIISQSAEEHSAGAESPVSTATVTKLQKLNNNLKTFLRRFELSLNKLDLYVFYPKAGEIFDDMYHVLEDEDAENVGRAISECIIPGIKKKANDDFGDDVIIRAEVRTETER